MIWGHDTLCNGKHVRMSGDDSVTWSCKLADGTEKSGVCDKVFNNTECTLDFHWPEDIPAEAIGRDIELTFRLHGGEADRAPGRRVYADATSRPNRLSRCFQIL